MEALRRTYILVIFRFPQRIGQGEQGKSKLTKNRDGGGGERTMGFKQHALGNPHWPDMAQ